MCVIEQIEHAIKQNLPDATVVASTFDDVHYSVNVRSVILTSLTRVKQHQAIYSALAEHIGPNWSDLIHALEIKITKEV